MLHDASKAHTEASLVEVIGRTSGAVDPTQLERSELELFHQRFEDDLGIMEVYVAKLASHKTLMYHHKLEHVRRRRLQAREAADTLFSGSVPAFTLCVADGPPANAISGLEKLFREVRTT